MLIAIHLIKRKVTRINQGFGGTVHKVKLHEPVVAAHILLILAVSVAYFLEVNLNTGVTYIERSRGVLCIFDSALSLMMSAIITNIIQEINYSRDLEAEA